LEEYLSYFEEAQMMVKIGESKIFAFPSFTLRYFTGCTTNGTRKGASTARECMGSKAA